MYRSKEYSCGALKSPTLTIAMLILFPETTLNNNTMRDDSCVDVYVIKVGLKRGQSNREQDVYDLLRTEDDVINNDSCIIETSREPTLIE